MKRNIREYLIIYSLFVSAIPFLSSCTSDKKLTYLLDTPPNQSIPGSPPPPPVYRIRVGDNLYVSLITQDADMNKMVNPSEGSENSLIYEGIASKAVNGNIVLVDGTVQLPLLGKVPVEGKTMGEAEEAIKEVAKEYLKHAFVKVRLLNYRVTAVGQVKAPGVYYNYHNSITIFDLIGLAQGTTDYVKLEDVLVIRNEKGGTKTYSLNLQSKRVFTSPAYYLNPEDVVVFQPGKNIGTQQKLSTGAVIVGSLSAIFLLLNFLKN